MAVSKVSIANGALQRLAAKRIESLTQDHPNARSMNAAYEPVRKALLRKYDWSFAIARKSIAADGAGPVWGDWDRFTKPNDFIRLLRDNETGHAVDWKIEGNFILSRDGAPLEIRYIADIDDPTLYDSTFVEAFECALAMKCCKEVTGSLTLHKGVKEDFDDILTDAKQSGAVEKEAEEFPEDDWVMARL